MFNNDDTAFAVTVRANRKHSFPAKCHVAFCETAKALAALFRRRLSVITVDDSLKNKKREIDTIPTNSIK